MLLLLFQSGESAPTPPPQAENTGTGTGGYFGDVAAYKRRRKRAEEERLAELAQAQAAAQEQLEQEQAAQQAAQAEQAALEAKAVQASRQRASVRALGRHRRAAAEAAAHASTVLKVAKLKALESQANAAAARYVEAVREIDAQIAEQIRLDIEELDIAFVAALMAA